jgi:uncharacterized protein YfaP (DUF2135 family)
MVNKNFSVLIIVLAAFAIGLAACGGGGGTLRAPAPSQAGSLTTDYTISAASGKAPSSELSFSKLTEPVDGENGIVRFRVNAGRSLNAPLALRLRFNSGLPSLRSNETFALKRIGARGIGNLPLQSGDELLLAVRAGGEYLVTRETRAAVSQSQDFLVFASADKENGAPPLTVNFKAWTDGGLTGVSYSWNFGDGGTSTEQNPTYAYQASGSFVVTLAATHGTDTFTCVSTPITASGTSVLSGDITDGVTHEQLRDITVTAITEGGEIAAVSTNPNGHYEFGELGQRTYVIAFTAPGYRPLIMIANLDTDLETLDIQLIPNTNEVTEAPQFTFPDPPYTLNETSGIATFNGSLSQFYGDSVAMAVNSQLTTTGCNAGAFTGSAILRPGANTVKFIAANEFGIVVSPDFIVTYNLSGDILFRATLTWDGPGDMDLHVIDPNGEHCYYSHKVIGTGSLDVDNVVAYGPENFTCVVAEGSSAVAGTYHVYVHDYDGSAVNANYISLTLNPGTPYEESATLGPQPLDSSSADWYAVNVVVDASGIATFTAPGSPPV